MLQAKLVDIISRFDIDLDLDKTFFDQISQGYINDTYLVKNDESPEYILQRINSNVFKDVVGLHNNINLALKKLKADDYSEICLFKTKTKAPYYLENGNCWRLLNFIPDSKAYNFTSNPKIAFEAGRIIGRFHQLLNNETLDNYIDTVPKLNYLPFHINEFEQAINSTSDSLKNKALEAIEFAQSHLSNFDAFYQAHLPERVCHNDTKLNNILFSNNNSGLCLIDLDTIMKGYFHYDFGDVVRTVVSEANEDEKILTNINFNLSLFKSLVEGINDCKLQLSELEIQHLPTSCILMPFMHGIRALTDYLNGNIHYKVSYPEQNLDRCKSLFQFAKLTLQKQTEIKAIIDKYLN